MLRKVIVGIFLVWVVVTAIGIFSDGGRDASPAVTETTSLSSPAGIPPNVEDMPTDPQSFDQVLYVTASRLNVRELLSTNGTVLASLPRNSRLEAGKRQGGWINVRTDQVTGWVSLDYISDRMVDEPVQQRPAQPAPISTSPAQLAGANCPGRLTCGQIGSCREARYYLANCSWGGRLDGDSDGVPCESMCR